jgi:phosphodiesterase/alkaline phosphatase D-like protein
VGVVAPPAPTPVGQWDGTVAAGAHSIAFRRLTIAGLLPRSRYRFELRGDGGLASDAIATTLPDHLPTLEERPFTIMLGSCFARAADGAGNAGRAYSQLPSDAQPDLKILCGDQVYLDQPTTEYLFHTHTEEGLRERHLANYARAWTQTGGFRELLRVGGTFFSSDDHDFWNNAPNATVIARDTWSQEGRDAWSRAARTLYGAFQRPVERPSASFRVDRLSFFMADTRLGRTAETSAFSSEADLAAIEAWARGLDGPGCLVVGQLVFSGQAGLKGRWMDYGLPDFAQYPRLVTALMAASHTVVILTGDVHYGRVAVCQLEPGRDIVEVVASPLALVAPFPSNTWHPAPPEFPATAIPGVVRRPVQTAESFRLNANQFSTIGFSRSGSFVRMQVQAWPVETRGLQPVPSNRFEYWIS